LSKRKELARRAKKKIERLASKLTPEQLEALVQELEAKK
jgi:hypothetical protein